MADHPTQPQADDPASEDLHVTGLRSTGRPRGRPFTHATAIEAGRRGGLVASANREDRLWQTREVLNTAAPSIAARIASQALGTGDMDALEFAAGRDVLDRTIGKAPSEVHLGPAEMATSIVLELSQRDGLELG